MRKVVFLLVFASFLSASDNLEKRANSGLSGYINNSQETSQSDTPSSSANKRATSSASKKATSRARNISSIKTRKSGFYGFIGFDIGIASLQKNYFNSGIYRAKSDITALPKIMGGIIYYANNYFGMRLYLDLLYGAYSNDSLKTQHLDFALNYDLLFRFFTSEIFDFGAYVGIASGSGFWFNNNIEVDFLLNANLGLNMEFIDHHAIELGATIPLIRLMVNSNYINGGSLFLSNAFKQSVAFNMRYIYRF